MSARVWPTHVRCGMAGNGCSSLIRTTASRVNSRVDPSAPYVTDTTDGSSGASSCTAFSSWRRASSVFGGKNSNEMVRPAASRSAILGIRKRLIPDAAEPHRRAAGARGHGDDRQHEDAHSDETEDQSGDGHPASPLIALFDLAERDEAEDDREDRPDPIDPHDPEDHRR